MFFWLSAVFFKYVDESQARAFHLSDCQADIPPTVAAPYFTSGLFAMRNRISLVNNFVDSIQMASAKSQGSGYAKYFKDQIELCLPEV